ncbi:soluble inorganic pyrophosphatase 6, chloroplastic-like [Arabidopsis lyrata subsp. lyrata]|uniref:soluble inorganic pyrophosphatase 6, chloroplastic-like n=1 Tax=Arabidopsis lyrata subsp. lyrata TaxID=81972 RepID=UPI000A29CA5A|nr:soluble inorganic pyrophosphatase 6, chloroplastic-like [Arabidopsis lyrata subsp. lyrata]|eukprot:XP_020881298.1 soluble inorganic pyrophosphatase 6, chloroplastic-like [Arabidopsis lyrata subsp. lyrata]
MLGLTTAAAASASQTTTSCLFIKRPFVLPTRKVCGFNGLCFNKRASLVVKSKRPFSCNAIYNPQVQTIQEYQSETFDYIVFFQDGSGKKLVSPWHDIPLHLGDGVFHFIVEIPKESRAKMEVATDEAFTPIKQDTKKRKLRYYP